MSSDGFNPINPDHGSVSELTSSFLHSVGQELTNPTNDENYDHYGNRQGQSRYDSLAGRSYEERHERPDERPRSRERRDRRNDRDYRRSHRRSTSPRDRYRSSSRRHEGDVVPLHKRVRRVNNWDMPPPGMEGMTAMQVKQTGMFPLPGQVLGTKTPQSFAPPSEHGYAGDPAWNRLEAQPQTDRINQQPVSSTARQARRIYVGQIPPYVDDRSAIAFFNQSMAQLQGVEDTFVANVQIYQDKSYAFVEFKTPELATAAMSLDGIIWQGQSLRVRRPTDYQPPADGEQAGAILGTGAVPDSPDKVFIGGLPTYLTDDQVKELLRSFGELKAFNLVKEGNGTSKGYAFCEYLDPNVTDLACQGLNNMELGDKKLIVQRASVGAKPSVSGANMVAMDQRSLITDVPFTGAKEDDVTNVLELMNMVVPEELEDDEEYQDIWEDIAEECGKFGQVVDMKIPRPKKGQDVPGCGSIFVRYQSKDDANAALRALAGRRFADRTVVASFIDEEKYTNDYV
ncbi:hypothetical protein DM01DRAFT_1326154 [Hesseltinella vesiculosa]|uniref:Splicing factor U2AF subunit n=1 Tax=Hesseltinella vesiculosa TaxID=101127 RepID=A0A1X2GA33_9FUNG|nr:hypothetical protein DM01DRAFT_1326154 [Hesseltinella vesiculosa]